VIFCISIFTTLFAALEVVALNEGDLAETWSDIYIAGWGRCVEHKASFDSSSLGAQSRVVFRVCGSHKQGAPIVVIPGYTEPAVKYMEVAYDLMQLDSRHGPIILVELPGQGSDLPFTIHPNLVHMPFYDVYPRAIIALLERLPAVTGNAQKPMVIGHSTGALAAMLVSQRRPELMGKIILTSPLIQPKLPFPSGLASVVSSFFCFWNWCDQPVFGKQPLPLGATSFQSDYTTSSEVRWNASNNLQAKYPSYYRSGLTWGWIHSVLKMIGEMKSAKKIFTVPTKVLISGDDRFVEPDSAREMCEGSNNCQLKFYGSARHELLQEIDSIRNDVFSEIKSFIAD
jgi:lysophospholipase